MTYKQRLWIGWLTGTAVMLSLTVWWAHAASVVFGVLVYTFWWIQKCPPPREGK